LRSRFSARFAGAESHYPGQPESQEGERARLRDHAHEFQRHFRVQKISIEALFNQDEAYARGIIFELPSVRI
jgi:hypothetical protein